MPRIAVLIDGGYLRDLAKGSGKIYDPPLIEQVAMACPLCTEELYRVMYYDCALFQGTVRLPVSGLDHVFTASDRWLREIAEKDYFAVRRGVLKFRGWVPKRTPLATSTPSDSDFKPRFVQKGVDMRIGLDMATFSATQVVDRLALLTNDTDCVPAMKHARRAGLQIALISLPNHAPSPELLAHADFHRALEWPSAQPRDSIAPSSV